MGFDRRGGTCTVVVPRSRGDWPAARAHRVATFLLIVLLGAVGVAALGADDRIFVAGGLVVALLTVLRITLAFERAVDPREVASPRSGYDPVTGLLAGRAFLEQAGADLAQADGRPVGVALIRLDHLDDIAEAFGSRAGDHVLRTAAQHVRRRTRAGDVLARSADAELALLVNGADAIEASRIGQRVVDEIARLRYRVEDHEVGAAVGIAIARGGTVTQLIDLADRALTAATRGRLQRVRVMELGGGICPLVIRSASPAQSTGSGIRPR
jgi:diguanylate cyclase (GGDEF)-like protein